MKPDEELEAKLATILESISDGFVSYDREWRYVYVNEKAAQVVDRKRDELIGKTLYELFPERMDTPIFQEFQRIMQEGKPAQIEYFSPGAKRWLRTNFYPSPEGMTTFFTDITEQMIARQRVEESEKHYRTLFNSIDEGFCVIEKIEGDTGARLDFRYLEANPAFAAQSGVDNVVGKTIRQAFPGEPEAWFETYDAIVRTGEPMRFERGLVTQGRVLELYAFRVEDETHRRVAVIFKDITEQKRAEQLRDEHERELAVNEERQRLARDLHDLVTQTLFSINVLAQTVPRLWEQDPQRAQEQLQQLAAISQGAMAEMRTLLLELRPATLVKASMQDLVDQLIHAAQARRPITITPDIELEQPLPEDVHVVLYRIVQESLNNMVKHSRATEGRITLTKESGQIVLRIQDNGRGFDVSETSAGLGLGMMRERAAIIGATLEVVSKPGSGTEIIVKWTQPI